LTSLSVQRALLPPRGLLRTLVSRVLHRVPPTPRAASPYSTHLPVLVGLATELPVRNVLEFGAGRFSTLTFLDRSAFPDVERVDSFDTDPAWRDEVLALANHDSRLTITLVDGPMHQAAASLPFEEYDLVLVDDSADEASRTATIGTVARCRSNRNVIVVHDYEMERYRQASSIIPNRFTFHAYNPYTGVCWESAPLSASRLRSMARQLQRYAEQLEPTDRAAWVEIWRGR